MDIPLLKCFISANSCFRLVAHENKRRDDGVIEDRTSDIARRYCMCLRIQHVQYLAHDIPKFTKKAHRTNTKQHQTEALPTLQQHSWLSISVRFLA